MDRQMGDSTDYERGAERLFEAVAEGCSAQADFVEQVRSALVAGLTFLASEPALADLLILRPFTGHDRVLLESYWSWRDRYADLLRWAARSSPEARTHPPFVEPTLLDGIRWQVAFSLLADENERLLELAPTLTRYVLCYYLPPERASHAVAGGSG
jgi:hypothetical protein